MSFKHYQTTCAWRRCHRCLTAVTGHSRGLLQRLTGFASLQWVNRLDLRLDQRALGQTSSTWDRFLLIELLDLLVILNTSKFGQFWSMRIWTLWCLYRFLMISHLWNRSPNKRRSSNSEINLRKSSDRFSDDLTPGFFSNGFHYCLPILISIEKMLKLSGIALELYFAWSGDGWSDRLCPDSLHSVAC